MRLAFGVRRSALGARRSAFGEIDITLRRNHCSENQLMPTLTNNCETEIATQRGKRQTPNANLSDETSIPTWPRNDIFRTAGTLAKSERQTLNAER